MLILMYRVCADKLVFGDKILEMANKFKSVTSEAEERGQENPEDSRLNLKEEQEETNMMRAYNREGQECSQRKYGDGIFSGISLEITPTPGDYEKAFRAIQEIKEMAEREPVVSRILYKIGRIIHNVGRVSGAILWSLISYAESGGETYIPRPDIQTPIADDIDKFDDRVAEFLTDAEKTLKEWERKGEIRGHVSAEDFKVHKEQKEVAKKNQK